MPAAVSWCRPEQVPAVMRLIDDAWKRGHVLARDAELLSWQYPPRADGGPSILVLDDEREGPVGLLGVVPTEFNRRGTTLSGAMMALWFVRPNYAEPSSGLRLLRHLLGEGYGFVGVLGIRESALPLYRALRFHVVPRIERWVRCYDAAALGALLAEAPDRYPPEVVERMRDMPATGVDVAASDEFEVVAWRPELVAAWDAAWRERFAPRLVGPSRSAAYLDWRYVRHPRFRYELRTAVSRRTGEVAGLLVYRAAEIRDRPQRVLRLVEFLAEPRAAAALTAEVARAARTERATFADFYCTSATAAAPLADIGFRSESPDDPPWPALFQPLDFGRSALNAAFYRAPPNDEAPQPDDSWYFTRGDGDQDRPS